MAAEAAAWSVAHLLAVAHSVAIDYHRISRSMDSTDGEALQRAAEVAAGGGGGDGAKVRTLHYPHAAMRPAWRTCALAGQKQAYPFVAGVHTPMNAEARERVATVTAAPMKPLTLKKPLHPTRETLQTLQTGPFPPVAMLTTGIHSQGLSKPFGRVSAALPSMCWVCGRRR